MGNAASEEDHHHHHDSHHYDEFAEFDGIETLGYRVLGVQPNSPASKAGLVSFFDFLVGANGQMLLGSGENLDEGEEYDDIDFPAMLSENKGKPIELLVWNIKSQQQRFVDLIPNDDWGGAGLLGVTIRLDNYGGADERLIRVLEVEDDNSCPAAIAGLQPLKDYLLGTTAIAFGSTKELADVLAVNLERVVEIYVYNIDSDMVRVASLMPTYNWGDENDHRRRRGGMLGAEVGTGYLHRLPKSCRSTIGTSVERKVRLATTAATGTTATFSNVDNNINPVAAAGADGGDETTDPSTQQQQSGEVAEAVTLELEPHLEMEAEKDSEGKIQNVEELTKQPHQLGNEEEESAPVPTQQRQQQQQQQSGENVSAFAKTTTNVFPEPTSIPTTTTTTLLSAPPEDAEALFSGPPPEAESEASSSDNNNVDSNSSLEVQLPNRLGRGGVVNNNKDESSSSEEQQQQQQSVNPTMTTTTTAATTTNFSGLPTPPKMNY